MKSICKAFLLCAVALLPVFPGSCSQDNNKDDFRTVCPISSDYPVD